MSRLIIFLGTYAEDNRLIKAESYQKSTAPTLSGNQYSLMLRDSLKKLSDAFIEISLFPGNTFPLNQKKYIDDDFWDGRRLSISFNNRRFFRNISIKNNLKIKIKKYILNSKITDDFDEIVIVNSDPRFPLVWASSYLKKQLPNSRLTLIFPDLPDLTNHITKNKLFLFLKKIESKKTYNLSNKYADTFVFFTEEMKHKFNISKKRNIVFPPFIIKRQLKANSHYCPSDDITVGFTGSTDETSSKMHLLISTFLRLNSKNIKLVIAGSGGNEEYLNNISKQHENIIYLGRISFNECLELQNSCDILISLREDTESMNLACSSKIFEYLSACKPIIAFHTGSLPRDVNDVIIHPKEHNEASISESINEAILKLKENPLYYEHMYSNVFNKYSPNTLANLIIEETQ